MATIYCRSIAQSSAPIADIECAAIIRQWTNPRFRRWLGYSYLPLNLTAWLTIAALLLIEAPLMALSFHVVPETLEWWGIAILSFCIF